MDERLFTLEIVLFTFYWERWLWNVNIGDRSEIKGVWLLWNWFKRETWKSEREGSIVILQAACFWVAFALALCHVALAGWLLCWDGIHLSIRWTAPYWCRSAKPLGFSWPSFWLVMSHILSAEHSKANGVQQGHDFSKVISWVIAEVGNKSELQTAKQRILLTRKMILSRWEGEIV